ncbi:PREDICTED: transcription factor bHLH113 isoform X1 [Theobroma cacao]|uniref:Transcription factor bHLH113 isoform X1 n=1 Tax=Theobroma cacao TaxID=3641 RepID=A0AB32VIU9_THECC|nr:PREDICTED: transcription factor bHLH113 isoform X1 [Theobroma cacao]
MMAETDQGFERDQGTATTTSFPQLLFGGDDDVVSLDLGQSFNYTYSSFPAHEKTPKMLCFGGQQTDAEIVFGESAASTTKTATTPQRSGVTCSDSSSASSGNNNKSVKTPSKSTRKRDRGRESVECTGAIVTAQPVSQRTNKKSKVENPATSTGHAKARKEKVGDRITALQQLVSPFGKTDTASVLHEAMGYIRFLHDQVQVLCTPYLQHLPDGGKNGGEESRKDLKSRGLCLVPVACTVHVANSNGADFWSPAMVNNVTKQ